MTMKSFRKRLCGDALPITLLTIMMMMIIIIMMMMMIASSCRLRATAMFHGHATYPVFYLNSMMLIMC